VREPSRVFTPVTVVVIAALVAVAAAWLTAAAYVAANRGFGVGDLGAMLLWSLPLGGLVALVARVPARLASRHPWQALLAAYAAAVALGLLVGVLWTVAAASLLGPWIGAFSFPVLACWVLGAVVGLVAAVTAVRTRTWPLGLAVAALVGLGSAAWVSVARRPPPMARVVFRPGTTFADVAGWRDTVFVGPPPPSGVGHSLPPDVQSYSEGGPGKDGRHTVTFGFFKGTSRARRDSLLAALRRHPIVERAEMLPAPGSAGTPPPETAAGH
jgi:hypothetical protein